MLIFLYSKNIDILSCKKEAGTGFAPIPAS